MSTGSPKFQIEIKPMWYCLLHSNVSSMSWIFFSCDGFCVQRVPMEHWSPEKAESKWGLVWNGVGLRLQGGPPTPGLGTSSPPSHLFIHQPATTLLLPCPLSLFSSLCLSTHHLLSNPSPVHPSTAYLPIIPALLFIIICLSYVTYIYSLLVSYIISISSIHLPTTYSLVSIC